MNSACDFARVSAVQSVPIIASGWCFMAIFRNAVLAWEYLAFFGILRVRNGLDARDLSGEMAEKFRRDVFDDNDDDDDVFDDCVMLG